MLSPDHVSALINRLDHEFDLEGLLAPVPGMVERAADPAVPDQLHAGALRAERVYAVSYADDQEQRFRGAGNNAVDRLMEPPVALARDFRFSFNGQPIVARIVGLSPVSNVTDSQKGLAVLTVRIIWEIKTP